METPPQSIEALNYQLCERIVNQYKPSTTVDEMQHQVTQVLMEKIQEGEAQGLPETVPVEESSKRIKIVVDSEEEGEDDDNDSSASDETHDTEKDQIAQLFYIKQFEAYRKALSSHEEVEWVEFFNFLSETTDFRGWGARRIALSDLYAIRYVQKLGNFEKWCRGENAPMICRYIGVRRQVYAKMTTKEIETKINAWSKTIGK